jgi:hypothetical protein
MLAAASSAPRSRVERWAPWAALAVLLGAAGVFVLWETRGSYFWFDEWVWIADRRELSAASFLEPHNQHLSLLPVAIYRALFETVGLEHYLPYRLVHVATYLACGLAVFLYARPRVGPVLGLAATTLILFLGPGAQNIMWPFQLAWLLSAATGIGALLALDRRTRRADVLAAALLTVSLASCGVAIAFVVAAAVDVALERRRWRDGLIVAAPLALYAVWWLAYQGSGPTAHLPLEDVPLWVLRTACASVLALTGLLRVHLMAREGPAVLWGLPLLIAAIALAVWWLHRRHRVPPRVIALAAGILVFWIATAYQRGIAAHPATSRYVWVGSLFVVLLAVEVARGVDIRPRVAAVLGALALVAAAANVPLLRDAGARLRDDGERTRVTTGVLEIARGNARAAEPVTILPGYPLVVITAGEYYAAARAWGPFHAASPAEIAESIPRAQQAADRELARIDGATVRPAAWRPSAGTPPHVDATARGQVTRDGGCVTFAAESANGSAIDVTVPPGGLVMRAQGGDATINLRRFSSAFYDLPIATVRAGGAVRLEIAPDRAPQPWHVHVRPQRSATLCPA